jgi:hypothetical protein
MELRLVSSLTTEDEDHLAPAVLTAVVSLLEALPISYAVRIETTGDVVLERSNLPAVSDKRAMSAVFDLPS